MISFRNPIYFYCKKHHCPNCSGKMRPFWTSSVTYSNDPTVDPSEFETNLMGYAPYGDVNVRHWQEFKCKVCGRQMTEKQLRDWEESHTPSDGRE